MKNYYVENNARWFVVLGTMKDAKRVARTELGKDWHIRPAKPKEVESYVGMVGLWARRP
jgi:hypothetical protein